MAQQLDPLDRIPFVDMSRENAPMTMWCTVEHDGDDTYIHGRLWVENVFPNLMGRDLVEYKCLVMTAFWRNQYGRPRDIWPFTFPGNEFSLKLQEVAMCTFPRETKIHFTAYHQESDVYYVMEAVLASLVFVNPPNLAR